MDKENEPLEERKSLAPKQSLQESVISLMLLERKVLTAKQGLQIVVTGLVMIVFCALVGLTSLHSGRSGMADVFAIEAVFGVFWTGMAWRRYRAVRNGEIVYVPSLTANVNSSHEAPLLLSVVALILLTGLAVGFSGLTAWLHHIASPAPRHHRDFLILVPFNMALWVYTVYCWYRLLFRRRGTVESEPLTEEPATIWPPPPRLS